MLGKKSALTIVLVAALFTSHTLAQFGGIRRVVGARGNAPGAGGVVTLPYSVADNGGNQWLFYQYGQFQQQGNMPIYSQGGMLQINGGYPQARNNQARVDEKSGELIFENMQVNGFSLTRRILINKEEGWVRYIDILKNIGNAEAAPNLNWTTSLNYGIQSAAMVSDPKKKESHLAWVATTQANGKVAVEMFAGKGAKAAPQFQYQQGNNQVAATMSPSIGAGKEVAVMHFHYLTTSVDAGNKFVLGMKESKILAGIPAAIRKLIINFRGGENFVGDYEILRGDILDIVELRTGDQLKGTLKEKTFKLEAFYGTVELPVEKVIGLINAGIFKPRQLIVTKDGEIFGGKLAQEKLSLELSSGQVTEIPLSQISRMGYRKRTGEAEEWTFEKPMVLMRTGDRIAIQMPTRDIDVVTRYGMLKLKPASVAAIDFQSEEHGVHQINLNDGSKFAGLVSADVFEMKLAGEGPEQVVKFPASSIRRLQLVSKSDDAEEEPAALNLANEDMLVGTLSGTMKLDTAFNTIALNGGEIKKLIHTQGSPSDVQVVLWDETTVSGQLQEQELICQLKGGVTIKVPVALVEEYSQPRPQPSAAVIESIKGIVTELSADDWKQRDAAQERLVTMGPVVIATLKQVRQQQSPEAQQRIDLILKQLDKDVKKDVKPAGTAPGADAGGGPVPLNAAQPAVDFIIKG